MAESPFDGAVRNRQGDLILLGVFLTGLLLTLGPGQKQFAALTAALADALSTAICLMDHADIARCLSQYPGTQARLIETEGNLITA